MEKTAKKNVLLIQTDEHLHTALGCAGSSAVKTPNIDSLARDGMFFRCAYSCSGVCVPSRASMHTGRYSIAHGVANNHIKLPAREKTMGQFFAENGYVNGYFGKTHLGLPDKREALQAHGWSESFLKDDYNRYLSENGIDAVYPAKPVKKRTRYWGAGASAIPAEHYFENVIADRACEFIRRNSGNNFLCYLSNVAPHGPFTPPPPYDDMYDPESIELAPRSEKELEGKPKEFVKWVRQNRKYLNEEELRIMVAATYGLITLVDDNVGKVVSLLKEDGLYDNTMIVFVADHGDFSSSYGIIGKSWCMDDVLMRIPLIISHPEHRGAAGETEALVQNVDILPTLMEYAGIQPAPVKMQGVSLIPLIGGRCENIRDAVFGYDQARHSGGWLYSSMVREGAWKYVHTKNSVEQLYNLKEDPQEFNNLAADKHHETLIRRLKDRLLDWHANCSGGFYDVESAGFWEDETCFYDEKKFGGGRINPRDREKVW